MPNKNALFYHLAISRGHQYCCKCLSLMFYRVILCLELCMFIAHHSFLLVPRQLFAMLRSLKPLEGAAQTCKRVRASYCWTRPITLLADCWSAGQGMIRCTPWRGLWVLPCAWMKTASNVRCVSAIKISLTTRLKTKSLPTSEGARFGKCQRKYRRREVQNIHLPISFFSDEHISAVHSET